MKQKKSVILFIIAMIFSFALGSVVTIMIFYKQFNEVVSHIHFDNNKDITSFRYFNGNSMDIENSKGFIPVDWLTQKVDYTDFYKQFGNQNDPETLYMLKVGKLPKYEIWKYNSPPFFWYQLIGREGICLVYKNGFKISEWKVITGIILGMN